jgi:hypothetical protein
MLMTTHSRNGTSARDVPRASARFQRAAAAELAALGRKRDRLMRRRDTVLAELGPIERAIGEIDRRIELLERLAGETQPVTPSPQTRKRSQRRSDASRSTSASQMGASIPAISPSPRRAASPVKDHLQPSRHEHHPGAALIAQTFPGTHDRSL